MEQFASGWQVEKGDDSVASIYVGNLAFDVTENELQAAFEAHGQVSAVNIIKDRETGQSRGFGFVEMPDGVEAKQAIEALNLSPINGRNMTVNEARPKENRSRGGGGRGRRW